MLSVVGVLWSRKLVLSRVFRWFTGINSFSSVVCGLKVRRTRFDEDGYSLFMLLFDHLLLFTVSHQTGSHDVVTK